MLFVKTPLEYLDEAINEINKATKSVLVQTMNFEEGELIMALEESLKKASERGVDVRLNYDWVASKYIHGDIRLLPPLTKKKRKYETNIQKKNREMYERLTASGVKLTVTNEAKFPMKHLPFSGRSHIKMLVVDEKICYVGGVNLYDGAFKNIDFMVKSEKEKFVSTVASQFYKVNENKHKKDYSVEVDSKETLFIDVGKKRKSIIYDQALKRIKEAKTSISYMSAFVPDGKILDEILIATHRDVDIKVYLSSKDSPVFHNYPDKLSYVYFKNIIKRKPEIKVKHLHKFIHAKLIIVDDELALYGSHNYTYSGVLFGTAEIMVETREEEIIKELKEFININETQVKE